MVAPGGRDDLADEAPFEVVEEEGGAEDGVGHGALALGRGADEVVLDFVLGLEVRHFGRGVDRGFSAPVHAREDEVPRSGCQGGVDQRFSLRYFLLAGQLHAEDAPGFAGQGGEDGAGVVEVAGDELDGGGFGGEAFGRGGFRVAGEGVDGEGGGVVGGVVEESAEDGAALLAGCAGDEDRFGHC